MRPLSDDAVAEPPGLAGACAASLGRSRARRALAARLRTRRRRTRGGGGTLAAALAAVALLAPLAAAGPASAPTLLREGSRGAPVAAVQRALGLVESARFDAATRRAVRAFQRRTGLVVDGIVGPRTRAALGLTAAEGGGAPSARAAAADDVPAGAAATLERIAACESGGDPTAVSPDGRYRGKYQFSRETWAAMGGSGDPARAPEAEQDRLAAALLAREGTAPWPACGA